MPGSSIHGISQARILEWVATAFSKDLLDSGIKPAPPALEGGFFPAEPPEKPPSPITVHKAGCQLHTKTRNLEGSLHK